MSNDFILFFQFKRPAIENEMMQGQAQAKRKKMVGLGVDTNRRINLQILNVSDILTIYNSNCMSL